MKVKTLIACAATAAALPLASAWATQPTGPQGTELYGRRDAMTFAQLDTNRDGVLSPQEFAAANTRNNDWRGPYSGPSWETNPPAPAQ